MTRGKHQRRGEHRAIGSLGLSLLVHGASLGALVALGGAFALAVQDRPRQLTFESPSLADLLEQPAPEDLTEVARAEETLEPEEEPLHDPAAFSDTWVVAPDLPGELPADELLDEPPADDWRERALREHVDRELRPPNPEPMVELPPEPVAEPPPPAPEPAPGPLPAPSRIEGKDPDYPKASAARRDQGSVTVRLELDAEGRVTLVELTGSSGHRRLDEAVMAVAPKWRFDVEGLEEGTLERGFLHTVHFRLAR